MNTLTFTCEIITPMFLAGADGAKLEIRPPSIKGALRFWWRAMHGHLPIEELRKKETEIFGGGGNDGKRSSVTIKIHEDKTEILKNNNIGIDNDTGIGYLLYSSLFLNKRDCLEPHKEKTFKVLLSSQDISKLKEAVKAFFCLVFFDGLGSRTRRGAGAICVKKIEGNAKRELINVLKIFKTKTIKTKEDVQIHIETYLKPLITNQMANGKYSTFNGAKLYLFEPKNNWKEALQIIGDPFKSFRSQHSIVSQISNTPNFGFPINHTKQKTTMIAGKTTNGKYSYLERRASPLIFKIIKTGKERYFPIIIWLNGELIPTDYEIMDKKGGHNAHANPQIIQDFLNIGFGNNQILTPNITL